MALRSSFLLATAFAATLGRAQGSVTFEKVYQLKPSEGVFAYSRVSGDGRYLAYASEVPAAGDRGAIRQTVTVVDLQTRRTLFEEEGIDAYWSGDGTRIIYLSYAQRGSNVSIWNRVTGATTRNVASAALGDYFSWAVRDGRDLILTIQGNFYNLDGDKGVMPHRSTPSCEGIGRGERPLISRDGMRATTFVRGNVVVRSLTDCSYILDTGLPGAKADFSWDGRYVAFHSPKTSGRGYDLQVVDLQQRTVRTVTSLPGSSYFPSWTRDGRLSFRYDGADYRGFMFASNVLSLPARPLPRAQPTVPESRSWSDVFPGTPVPETRLSLVLVWGTWSAHMPDALFDLTAVQRRLSADGADVSVWQTPDPSSHAEDVQRLLRAAGSAVPQLRLDPTRLLLTEIHNQNPTVLLFERGRLIDRKLGPQSMTELLAWVASFGTPLERQPRGGGR